MKFDRNGNKRLSVSELAECLAERRNRLGLNPSDQIAARGILRQMDRDGNGTIEAGEIPPGTPGAFLMNCDQNMDGDVTELELERSYGDRRKMLGYDDQDFERASTLIQRNDSDRSKSLSRSELVASGADRNSPLSPSKLTTIDEDSDQRISVDELAKYLKKTR
jgi:Ca2+-binding EF-hand superfamily protein